MGQAERPNGAFGKSDIEGKAAMEAASELGSERVSKERERISQSAVADDSTLERIMQRRKHHRLIDSLIVVAAPACSRIFSECQPHLVWGAPPPSRAVSARTNALRRQ